MPMRIFISPHNHFPGVPFPALSTPQILSFPVQNRFSCSESHEPHLELSLFDCPPAFSLSPPRDSPGFSSSARSCRILLSVFRCSSFFHLLHCIFPGILRAANLSRRIFCRIFVFKVFFFRFLRLNLLCLLPLFQLYFPMRVRHSEVSHDLFVLWMMRRAVSKLTILITLHTFCLFSYRACFFSQT